MAAFNAALWGLLFCSLLPLLINVFLLAALVYVGVGFFLVLSFPFFFPVILFFSPIIFICLACFFAVTPHGVGKESDPKTVPIGETVLSTAPLPLKVDVGFQTLQPDLEEGVIAYIPPPVRI